MPYFSARMHPIQFRLGLRRRPPLGSVQCSLDPLAGGEGLADPSPKNLTPSLSFGPRSWLCSSENLFKSFPWCPWNLRHKELHNSYAERFYRWATPPTFTDVDCASWPQFQTQQRRRELRVTAERYAAMVASSVVELRVRRTVPRAEVHDQTEATWRPQVTCLEAGTRPPVRQPTRPSSRHRVPG